MTTHIEAVADVIRALGFDAMAQEYIDCPEYRDRIRTAMTRIIAREHGPDKARAFGRLAAHNPAIL